MNKKKWLAVLPLAAIVLLCTIFLFVGENAIRSGRNANYEISRIDGQYYINFYDGNLSYGEIMSQEGLFEYYAIPSYKFDNVEQMRNIVKYGLFSEDRVYGLKEFPRDRERGIYLFDLDHLYVPITPDGQELGKVNWYGGSYGWEIQAAGMDGQFCCSTQLLHEKDLRRERNYLNADYYSVDYAWFDSETNTEGWYYYTEWVQGERRYYKRTHHTYQVGGKVMEIWENYLLKDVKTGDSLAEADAVLDSVIVLGTDNGAYFKMSFNWPENYTGREGLYGFGVKPYKG